MKHEVEAYSPSATTGEDGAFVLQGATHFGRVAFTVSLEGFTPRSLVVPLGSSDLVVHLWHGGGVAGRVRVDDENTCAALDIVAARDGEGRGTCSVGEDGAFALEDLEPGLYDIAVRLPIEPEFSCVVPGVGVESGMTSRDARLQTIDLRGALRTFRLTLVPPHADTYVRRRPAGTSAYVEDEWSTEPFFTTSHPALDLRLSTSGHRTLELLGVNGDRQIELQPALEVELRLSPPIPLCEKERLALQLTGCGDEFLPPNFGSHFRDGETAVAHLFEGGDYRVGLVFLQANGPWPRRTCVPLEPGTVIHVLERDTQRFEIALPPAALASIERARADPPPRAR